MAVARVKVGLEYLRVLLTGASLTNYQITSGAIPTDSVITNVELDKTTSPPTIIVEFSSSHANANGFYVAKCTAFGNGIHDNK